MDASVSTVVLPSFQPTPDHRTLKERVKLTGEWASRKMATLSEAKDIARAEMARQRRRLGTLTREQEIEVEHLLRLTVTKVAQLTGRVLEAIRG